jgi:hypothetical protein
MKKEEAEAYIITGIAFALWLIFILFQTVPKNNECNDCDFDRTPILQANCTYECENGNFTHFDVKNPYTNNSIWSKDTIIGCCTNFGFCDCKDYNKYQYVYGVIRPLK